jgi:2-oxo-4-hydroxy-4-carboxy-5-ureidoimidazoline decarboxylase
MVTLEDINAMTPSDFVAAFGDVAEHSPWVAEAAAARRPFASREAMITAFEDAVMAATPEAQLALLRAHPDLAGRAALAGDVSEDSRREQAGAGLASLTAQEFERFTRVNTAYRQRFGFPFILAVRGASKQQILSAFEMRQKHGQDDEMRAALAQVMRIFRLRLDDRVAP